MEGQEGTENETKMETSARPEFEQAVAAVRESGLEGDASKLLPWAFDLLGEGLMMSTAFGKSGMCILHMIKELDLPIPVYFIDTGFHFPETLQFVETLRSEWGVNLILERPRLYGIEFIRKHGEKLYETDPDFCCQKNKVEPFAKLLSRYTGWITGVRRDQSATRATAEPIEILEGGKLKLQPLAFWTREHVNAYIKEHKIPLHPLLSQGYTSIGCAPCTRPNADPDNERAGRWSGKAKTECGLHTNWKSRTKRAVPPSAGTVPSPEGKNGTAPDTGTENDDSRLKDASSSSKRTAPRRARA